MPHLSGPRRYFFHHSYKVLSLQNYPSLAGKTGGTRIEKYRHSYYATRSQVQRTTRTCSLVQTVLLGVQFARRRCGSCSVFEVAQSVYKYAPNRISDKATPSAIINYQLLISMPLPR